MNTVDIERVRNEIKDIGITHPIEVFFIRGSYLLHNTIMSNIDNLLKNVNTRISKNIKPTEDELMFALGNVEEYLLKFNRDNVRNEHGYGIEIEYSLSVLTIILNVRYYSPSGNVYYIDDVIYRELYANMSNFNSGEIDKDKMLEYVEYYSKLSDGRIDYKMDKNNKLYVDNLADFDTNKLMNIINLLADTGINNGSEQIHMDNIIYKVSEHLQINNTKLPKEYKIISFKIAPINLNLNLKDLKEYEYDIINKILDDRISYTYDKQLFYQKEMSNYGMKRVHDRRYAKDDLDYIEDFKNYIQEVKVYQDKVNDNIGKDFIINTTNSFIIQTLYTGAKIVKIKTCIEIQNAKNNYFTNNTDENRMKLSTANKQFDFCVKLINSLESVYKNLNNKIGWL